MRQASPEVEAPSLAMRLLAQPLLVAAVATLLLSPLVWTAHGPGRPVGPQAGHRDEDRAGLRRLHRRR
ncbi:hypothetical protein LP420_33175 [Massilia sp. B-10]|nr:hypothetical protein LP420_33175 [Massilia sp. B-10]